MRSNERLVLLIFSCLTALIVALAVVGGLRTYSPVPYWDMWDGYLDFYLKVSQGDWSRWWAQHNEHRILWSRILFCMDIRWFAGTGAFLIIVNYVLAGIAGLLFWRILAWSISEPSMRVVRWGLSLFLLGWMFSWCQNENFTWGFQSQFFLAQLLPLCALIALYRSTEGGGRTGIFILACLLGLASMGSMANGVIVLPLMVLCGLLLRIGSLRIMSLLALAVGGGFLYFHDYSPSTGNVGMFSILVANPIEVGRNLLVYLGSPFYFLMRKSSHSVQIAAGAGFVLIVSSIIWGVAAAGRGPKAGLRLVLLSYLLFIGGTALATAIGRLQFGPDQILSSRYSTPAVMAWATYFVLLADSLRVKLASRPIVWLLPVLALHAYVAIIQARSLPHPSDTDFRRHLAAIAMTVGAKDPDRISTVYPYIDHAIDIARRASEAEVSIFGSLFLRGVRAKIGTQADPHMSGDCSAGIDYVHHLETGDYDRIAGWIRGHRSVASQGVWIIDQAGKRAGYALSSSPAAMPHVGAGPILRFDGYVKKAETMRLHSIQVEGASCAAALEPLSPRFTVWPAQSPALGNNVVSSGAVLSNDGWNGSDYQRSVIKGFELVGSNVRGDSDVGTIKLKLRPGDSVFYRSGPVMDSQFIQIGQSTSGNAMLPSAENWVRLEFSNPALPGGEFEVTFTDAGRGFGEWSAIALRADK